ncbi:hypothetical protein D5R40_13130 [Okeania hirsuta]|uniref:Uncharacterized protein n=1 Tax=Okeania hirsuta TaxID=1458930 RepID=A0A3N6PUN1_9CYAN|nr:hypothetical protein [Okeania hirsuta]RQH43303.1 hypothetical protein D5R40_13130 [Okeania hirsuta]
MSESNILVKITISDPELNESQLQQATQYLQAEIKEVYGVLEVNQIPISEVEERAKSIGGFLINVLTAEVSLQNLKTLVKHLGNRTFGRIYEIEAEGNGRKLKAKFRRPEDLETILPEVDKFLKG